MICGIKILRSSFFYVCVYHNRHVGSGKKKKKHTLIMLFSNIWVLYFLIHELFIVFCLYTSFHKIKYKLRKLSLNIGPE